MKDIKFYAGLMLMAVVALFASCSSDDDGNKSGTKTGPVTCYDQVSYLQGNIVDVDTLGNVKNRVNGAMLNPTDTTELSVGVKDVNEAAALFKSWLSPDTKVETISPSAVNMEADLTDGTGAVKETVYFKATNDPDVVAEMTFKNNNVMKHVTKMKFVLSSAWPENGGITPYVVGEHAIYNTNLNEGYREYVCVREAKEGQAGLMVYISQETTDAPLIDLWKFASAGNASTVSSIIRADWDTFAEYFADAGMSDRFKKGESYWYDHYVYMVLEMALYSIDLSTGSSDWTLKAPWIQKHALLVECFGLARSGSGN